MEQDTNKISLKAGIILLIIAIIADAFTLIPFVGALVGPMFWVGATFYFWKVGLGFVNWGRISTSVISTLGELTPAVQFLPFITVGVIAVLILDRIQAKTGISLTSLTKGKIGPKMNTNGRREPPARIPLNNSQGRPPNGGLVK